MYLNCHAIFIYLTLQGFMCMNVAYSFIELTKLLRYRHRYHCLEHGIWASTSKTEEEGGEGREREGREGEKKGEEGEEERGKKGEDEEKKE